MQLRADNAKANSDHDNYAATIDERDTCPCEVALSDNSSIDEQIVPMVLGPANSPGSPPYLIS